MDVDKINLNLVKFKKGYGKNINVFINNKKIIIKTPIIKSLNGIESNGKSKYFLRLDMNEHSKLVSFLKRIDCLTRSDDCISYLGNDDLKYINCFYYNNNTWKVKIPFKYGRFNIDIIDKEGNKLTTDQINQDNNMICHIELSNIWNFNNSYGCIWNLKKIELQN
tara:strand:+ start:696 stop:1190 length:495 start_codon:yes stop_codon:yes gene_type:complete